ncbi:MAG: hydantoinase/oxoprolinase family protein [Kouleothrix sp.]
MRELEARLQRMGVGGNLFLMLSSGGIATVDTAVRYPVRLLESGPAAGALAATAYGQAAGHPHLLSFDMGGTTAKICVIDQGRPLIAHEFEVDRMYRFKKGSGLPITIPVIEMIEIGTGGGLDRARRCAGAAEGRPRLIWLGAGAGVLWTRRQRANRHRCRPGAGLPRPGLLPGRAHGTGCSRRAAGD